MALPNLGKLTAVNEPGAVVARDLVKVFAKGSVRALDGLSFEVEAGTVFGLLGPNGSGRRPPCASSPPSSRPTRAAPRSSATTSSSARRWCGARSASPAVRHGRRELTGTRTAHGGAAQPPREEGGLDQGRRVARPVRPRRRRPTGRSRPTRAACGADSTSPPPSSGAHRSCSRRAHHRNSTPEPPGPLVVIEQLVGVGTTVLLTTQYLESRPLAHQLLVIDHGKAIAEGTRPSSKRRSAPPSSRSPSRTAQQPSAPSVCSTRSWREVHPRRQQCRPDGRGRSEGGRRGPADARPAPGRSAGLALREPSSTTCS